MQVVQLTPDPTINPRRRLRRGGFTLLEILVVIGIILLLVTIGVIGFGALDQSGRLTKTTLENLKGMLAEYEQRTQLREQPPRMWFNDTQAPTNPNGTPPMDLWRTPVLVNGATNVSGDKRYSFDGVANMQIVMQYLSRVPENKQSLTKLPSKQVQGMADAPKGTPVKLTPTNDEKVIDPPIILDAWNNPIIYVGSDGLAGVTFTSKNDGKDEFRVTSTGLIQISPGGGLVNPNQRSKSWRPFFASAGPDGDFRTGDDNVYSFQQ